MAKPDTRYVVSRLHWWRSWQKDYRRSPREVAVASFATLAEAEADRWARERRARGWVNPFECGTAVHQWTQLDEPRLRDWLMDHGIDPPTPKKEGATDWAAWWVANYKTFGGEKQAVVWDVLDKVRFYSVAARPVRLVVYAIVKVEWEYNDQWQVAYGDGGAVQTVYRRREAAVEACERMNAAERRSWGDGNQFDIGFRLEARRDPFAAPPKGEGGNYREHLVPLTEAPMYEVVELELEEANGPRA